MQRLIIGLVLIWLAGCTEIASDAKRIIYDDGLRYIEENHESRRGYRAKKEAILSELIDLYIDCMRGSCNEERVGQAEIWAQRGLELLAENYRELATIEALRAGIEDFGEFKARYREEVDNAPKE